MEYMTGELSDGTTPYSAFKENEGKVVSIKGAIHNIRDMSDFAFIILRTARELIQCVYSPEFSDYRLKENVVEQASAKITGKVVKSQTRDGSERFEIQIHDIEILSVPAAIPPVVINKKQVNCDLNIDLDFRPVTLRNPKERAVFKIQEGIQRGFREHLSNCGFTEIHTPKINFAGAEGGTNVFKLDYFGKTVFLAQSPQLYKQALVPVYERVFEIGPVFRAEHHDTSRHLNEYISMDFEMGFIDSFTDVMEAETGAIKNIIKTLNEEYARELKILNVTLPEVDEIPCVRFKDAKEMVAAEYGRKIKDPYDLEPEEEQLISKLFKEKYNSEFVFVTHYPVKKRPFYAMDDPEDPKYTLSFDLLFRGMEVTTGGQRIHDYDMQVEKMIAKGLNPEDFTDFLMIHKHGMPPHGGLGMGLERFCMKLMDESNVRVASLFPRDLSRLTP